jgi:hypothetical protein
MLAYGMVPGGQASSQAQTLPPMALTPALPLVGPNVTTIFGSVFQLALATNLPSAAAAPIE